MSELNNILDANIDRLELSVRALHCLRRAKITTLRELIQLNAAQILRMSNVGRRVLEELRVVLGSVGLKLATDSKPLGEVDEKKLGHVVSSGGIIFHGTEDQTGLSLLNSTPDIQARLVTRLKSFPLSVRTSNVLHQYRIVYLGDLIQSTETELLKLQNMGRVSLNELKLLVGENGFDLGTNIVDWNRSDVTAIEKKHLAMIQRTLEVETSKVVSDIGPPAAWIEEELQRIACVLEKDRNARMLIDLWGWAGDEPRTLESVGNELAITRERVRQIEAKALRKLEAHVFQTPFLDAALSNIRKSIPGFEFDLNVALKKSGLSKGQFSVRSLKRAAEILNRRWPYSRIVINERSITCMPIDAEHFERFVPLIRKRNSEAGYVNLHSIASEVGFDEAKIPFLRSILGLWPGLVWLDEQHEWFFLRQAARNRLFNLSAKVLGVCPQIRVAELRRAVSKSNRLKIVPSQRILSSFVEEAGLGKVHNGIVTANANSIFQLDPSSAEAVMIRTLDEYGPVMDREIFAERCIKNGMNASTFYVYTLISPVVTQLARGVCSKVGANVPPGVVEDILAKRKADRKPAEYGWTTKGHLWFGLELSRIIITTGSIRVNQFVADLIQGAWTVALADGSESGTVNCKDWFVNNFRKQLAFLEAEPDDNLVIEFDRKARRVTIRLGGPELFESFASGSPVGDAEEEG